MSLVIKPVSLLHKKFSEASEDIDKESDTD
jgi:hypothetical protein